MDHEIARKIEDDDEIAMKTKIEDDDEIAMNDDGM